MGVIKQIDIKNRTIFIDIKYFGLKLLKIEKKLYKAIGIYNIGYITIKKLVIVNIFTM